MKQSSILNDVLGPVMAGPSSSHTAAPGKIGLAVGRLWGKPIRRAVVTYDAAGSYPSTHIGQGSDFGFTGGLLGMQTDDVRFRDSIALARGQGVRIEFRFGELGAHHPNEARIEVFDGDSDVPGMSVLSFSTGGGTFLLSEVDGFPIHYDGQRQILYIACEQGACEKQVCAALQAAGASFRLRMPDPAGPTRLTSPGGTAVLAEVVGLSREELPPALADLPGIHYIRQASPVVPVPLRLAPEPPFLTAEGALRYAGDHGVDSMPELALAYECSLGLTDRESAYRAMEHVLAAMRTSLVPPSADDPVDNLLIPRQSGALASRRELPFDMGVANLCLPGAVAVMENSCAHRAVVAAPTAGSSGVIPAAVVAVGEQLGCTDRQILDALWAAGLVGAFIANQATFGAEVAGCQAEIGAAACMAAAGVVQLKGGTTAEGFHAACIAMHSFLGLVCDPIAGLTEFPCIERNVTAAAVSVMSANMALCGMTSLIPLDETIQTMMDVGQMLPSALCCTCEGGLCATKTGRQLAEDVAARRAAEG